jgi:hypothetical protein
MNLFTNSLIEWNDTKNTQRILHNDGEFIAAINIFSGKGMPEIWRYDELKGAFLNGSFRILEKDPYTHFLIPETEISEKHKRRRDIAWELIREIIEAPNLEVFNPRIRGKLIAQTAKKNNKDTKTIYRLLERYWKGGMTKNSLLPRFKNCGGKGKSRTVKSTKVKKLGRWSSLSKTLGENRGIPITTEIKRYFQRGLKEFYGNQKRKSLRLTYQLILENYFHIGYEFKGDIKVYILPSADKLPSFNQFRHYYETEYKDPINESKSRQGEINFQLRYRELLGNSTEMAFGPGSLFQIEATLVDLYLVSSFDRTKIIGRPVLYLIVDVFSRVIVGMAVLLEGPSWLGAMLALDNAMSDKVAFCAEYGIEISPEQWNCHHLPKAILADRGEFEGYNADTLVSSLGIIIHNTAPYRADLKAIVERQFRILNEKFVHFEPGAVVKHRDRGEKDYRLDAVLTINEFRTLMIAHILNHNRGRHLKYYRKDEFMIADKVERFPIDLWNWGIQNRTGYLRTLPCDVVRMNLLPRREISVTTQGLHFERELYYSCDPLLEAGLMMRKRGRKSPKVTIAYDPRTTDYIYLPSSDNCEVTICPLTPAAKTFLGRDLYEARAYFNEETQDTELSRTRQIQSQAEFHAISNHVTKNAIEKAEEAYERTGDLPKSQRTNGIRDNRALEREIDRKNNSWEFGQNSSINEISNSNGHHLENQSSEETHVSPLSNADRIREIRNRKKGGKK